MVSTGSSSSAVTVETASTAATDTADKPADIVVGLVSHNNAGTAGTVIAAVRDGLMQALDGGKSQFVLADCGSTDDTSARVREALRADGALIEVAATPTTTELLEHPYHRIPGKARALHGILTAARELGARGCLVLDAGIESVTPRWVQRVSEPLLGQEFDLVAPYYHRHPYEGALTKGIVYPLFRALYGVRLRQPAAGEFACSSRLFEHFLNDDVWERDGAQVGIDLWLASSAVSGDFRIGEVELGVRRQQVRPDEALDLGTTITQVVGGLFADLENRVDRWQRVRGSVPVPTIGEGLPHTALQSVAIDQDKLIESFRLGYRELREIWTWVLPPRTIIDLRRLMSAPAASFHLDDDLWARIIYDFALGYRLRVLARDHILRSLVPLYLAWLASFIIEVRDRGDQEVEQRLERLGTAFEAQKPYLISKWRWPERLRS
jgi:glucosylglycerate synthase